MKLPAWLHWTISLPVIAVVGRLDTYITRTGFEVIPVVGLGSSFQPEAGPG